MNSNRAFIFLLSSGKIIILVFVLNLYFFSQFFFSGEDFKLNATYKEGVFQMELQTYDQKKDSQQNVRKPTYFDHQYAMWRKTFF